MTGPGGGRAVVVLGAGDGLGGAIARRLQGDGCSDLITRTHAELDLTDQAATGAFFEEAWPEYVFLAAAKAGGILANSTYAAVGIVAGFT